MHHDISADESTENVKFDTSKNHLNSESSPYLLQHADNPVDWYPWSDEAFDRARKEQKPIFLSIGYSACHWCHVMEKESFENPDIAAIMNEYFVCIKVDREERPDVDDIYMTSVQMLTGRGGWPLSVFLTPDLKPFYGGTYFPPEDRYGMPGFRRVLLGMAQLWKEQKDKALIEANQLGSALQIPVKPSDSSDVTMTKEIIFRAIGKLKKEFDPVWGGFGDAPKFPSSAAIGLLLRNHFHTGDQKSLQMATLTLDKMARGGMYDHLGGGFHRYSVDEKWLVPHFEKMLYDNALLSQVYLEAYQLTEKPLYLRIATETLEYVLREMTDSAGGFYSAQDADSDGEEGKYYVWSKDEIVSLLGEDASALFCDLYGVIGEGNFEENNILHIRTDLDTFAQQKNIPENRWKTMLQDFRKKLLSVREKRIPPFRDDKILVSWNGLMISSFARAYQITGEKRYIETAKNAASFILKHMFKNGKLLHSYRDRKSKIFAFLDDYAYLINALIDLYESTFDVQWLQKADELTAQMDNLFRDKKKGGFFFTSLHHTNLITRTKPYFDGSTPSGNASAALALLRIAKLLDRSEYYKKAEATIMSSQELLNRSPDNLLNMVIAVDFYLDSPKEIAIAGKKDSSETRKILSVIHERFIPNKVIALLEPKHPQKSKIETYIPLLSSKIPLSGKTTVYVCENYMCRRPATEPEQLAQLLD